MQHEAEQRGHDDTALRDSHVQGVGLGLGVTHFYRYPPEVQERLHELVQSVSDTQGLHFVQELGMPHSVEGPFCVKEVGDGRETGRRGFLDMFREPDNVLHATPAFLKPNLAYREYSLFLKELLWPVFHQSLVHFAKVGCEGNGPVACREVPWLSIFGDGNDQGFLLSRRDRSRLPACLVELEQCLCHRLREPADHMVGDRVFPSSLAGCS